jgi:hypothetical protein
MRAQLLRFGLGLFTALVVAVPVLAGGWATVTLDSSAPQPRAGEHTSIGFTLLQHGQTPISWESVTLVARNLGTGESVVADARPEGKTGQYVVTVTFPSEGRWSWELRTKNLFMETRLDPLTVLPAASPAPTPGGLPSTLLVAVGALAIGVAAVCFLLVRGRGERPAAERTPKVA